MGIKVVIADDHAVVRAGLRTLLKSEPGFELLGEAASGFEVIELVKNTSPDVLVLDISMPDLDGIAVTKIIKSTTSKTKILILTVHEDDAMAREAIESGASGYILKHAAESELINAIRRIVQGDLVVDPSLLRPLFFEDRKKSDESSDYLEQLTQRETDVLKLIVEGYTNRQIGEELHLSVRTVEGHRSNIYDKLGLSSRVELVRYAKKQGIIRKESD
ncbi:MAG: response regulator transcription factor [Pelolinea sp.]|nr:response regulator transcription factor [Pelolinea sp.]